ncbi:MAG: hypothetical protein IJN63_04720 [Clostridia bacterium]|nr:hypothetical protein [Clostridia bacterium]
MLLDPKKTTVAYRCPVCGCGVMAPVGVFSLTADRMKLNCVCKKSAMDISKTKDDKVRLSTPCLACGSEHSFTVSTQVFFSRDIFSVPCSVSGLDVCFFGQQEKVRAALDEQEQVLRSMVGLDEESEYDEETPDTDDIDDTDTLKNMNHAEIYDIIKFILMELEEDGLITCGCKDGHGDYDALCLGDKVKVFCRSCGRFKNYPIASVREAEKFLQIDEIHL